MPVTMVGRVLRHAARSRRRRAVAGLLLRAAAPILPEADPPDRPIFIVGSPRSGTTLLFDLLARSPGVASLGGESHFLWELFHRTGSGEWSSHSVGPEEITDRERRVLYWAIHHVADGSRYLDKSPRNSLRVPYLQALFADACFVFLKRDGRAAVSSLITGWRSDHPAFPGTRLDGGVSIRGYGGDRWKFVVPPGWERFARGRTLPDVCAFQWVASNEAILAARDAVRSKQWVEIAYEELVNDPEPVTIRLLDALGLPRDQAVLQQARALDTRHSKVTVTSPRPHKWREENREEVEGVLPLIAPTMRRLGYDPAVD